MNAVSVSEHILVAVEGCVGAGKTTVARALARSLGYRLLLEDFDANPFLDKFYMDPERYALETEICFVLVHYHQLVGAFHSDESPVVSDFTFGKDALFARMNLSEEDKGIFFEVFDRLCTRVPLPSVTVCLHCSDELLLQRIKMRSRENEVLADPGYFKKLNGWYEQYFGELDNRVVHVEMDKHDFVLEDASLKWLTHEVGQLLS
jgi:deoxyguanosine kinase